MVRFAETEGFEYDRHRPGAWRYRDYVIRSFNDDKPYDQFVREQLAGDEIAPGQADMEVAVGFLSPRTHPPQRRQCEGRLQPQ